MHLSHWGLLHSLEGGIAGGGAGTTDELRQGAAERQGQRLQWGLSKELSVEEGWLWGLDGRQRREGGAQRAGREGNRRVQGPGHQQWLSLLPPLEQLRRPCAVRRMQEGCGEVGMHLGVLHSSK